MASTQEPSSSVPATFEEFLRYCHEFDVSISVNNDPHETTTGEVTRPEGRFCPDAIIIVDKNDDDFHRNVFDLIPERVLAKRVHYNKTQLAVVTDIFDNISSEPSAQELVKGSVIQMAIKAWKLFMGDEEARAALGLVSERPPKVEHHHNVGSSGNREISRSMKLVRDAQKNEGTRKASTGDLYVYFQDDAAAKPLYVVVEVKAPHKVPVDTWVQGLKESIFLDHDFFRAKRPEETEDRDKYDARRLMAAVVTQLYAEMVSTGVLYGIASTAVAYLYLRIRENEPRTVDVMVSVPAMDVTDTQSRHSLANTAVARVFYWIWKSRDADAANPSWNAVTFQRWPAAENASLSPSSESVEEEHSPFESPREKGEKPASRMTTRSRTTCKDDGDIAVMNSDEERDDRGSPSRRGSRGTARPLHRRQSRNKESYDAGASPPSGSAGSSAPVQQQGELKKARYCRHECLLGIKNHRTDLDCPNALDHPTTPPELLEIEEACSKPNKLEHMFLGHSGSVGVLYKIRAFGYVFVAKRFPDYQAKLAENEKGLYDILEPLQGETIPVCLGLVTWRTDPHANSYVLLMSHGGNPLHAETSIPHLRDVQDHIEEALHKIHGLGVAHNDVRKENILVDPYTGRVMFCDFERAISQPKKRKRTAHELALPVQNFQAALKDDDQCLKRVIENDIQARIKGRPCFADISTRLIAAK